MPHFCQGTHGCFFFLTICNFWFALVGQWFTALVDYKLVYLPDASFRSQGQVNNRVSFSISSTRISSRGARKDNFGTNCQVQAESIHLGRAMMNEEVQVYQFCTLRMWCWTRPVPLASPIPCGLLAGGGRSSMPSTVFLPQGREGQDHLARPSGGRSVLGCMPVHECLDTSSQFPSIPPWLRLPTGHENLAVAIGSKTNEISSDHLTPAHAYTGEQLWLAQPPRSLVFGPKVVVHSMGPLVAYRQSCVPCNFYGFLIRPP